MPRLGELVSSNWSAFISGRCIHDNLLLVQQVMSSRLQFVLKWVSVNSSLNNEHACQCYSCFSLMCWTLLSSAQCKRGSYIISLPNTWHWTLVYMLSMWSIFTLMLRNCIQSRCPLMRPPLIYSQTSTIVCWYVSNVSIIFVMSMLLLYHFGIVLAQFYQIITPTY